MSPRKIQVENVLNFTAGLNLRADAFQLGQAESPDLLNVDVDPRGGFRLRKGVAPFGGAVGAEVNSLFSYETTGGSKAVFAGIGFAVAVNNGVTWTPVITAMTAGGPFRSATFKDRLYVQNGTNPPHRYDGAAAALGQAWNDAIEAPSNGNMPIGRCITSHQGVVWVANTLEEGVRHPNRLRFSHPNFPEDWRSLDYIDIDIGADGDEITALMPFGDHLLVFKHRSIHAVYGYSPETFQVFPKTREVGCISQEAVVNTDLGVYFFSWPDGVFLYQGKEPRWQFEPMYPAILNGTIPDSYQSKITLGWGKRRLWVSVPWNSTTASRAMVLDPSLGKNGSWVMYDLAVGPFLEWKPPGEETVFLASNVAGSRVLQLEQDRVTDDFGAGGVHINSHYKTRWFDLNQVSIQKKWYRPEFLLQSGTTADVLVELYRDYHPSKVEKTFRLGQGAATTGDKWDEVTWDNPESKWAGTSDEANEVKRGPRLGRSRSVSFRFVGPDTDSKWGVNSVSMKFVPKKVKG